MNGTSSSARKSARRSASNRLVWALGYIVEELYYVPSGKVVGREQALKSVKRLHAADGTFERAHDSGCATPGRRARQGTVDISEEPFL